MKYQAVIFDLFGTLVDNFTNSGYNQVLTDMSVILHTPQQGFINLWRGSFPMRVNGTHPTVQERIRNICGQLGVIITGEQVEQAVEVRLAYSLRTLIPRPDALPTIKKLKAQGYKVGMQPVLIHDPGENADTLFIDREMAWPGPKITNLKEVLGLI